MYDTHREFSPIKHGTKSDVYKLTWHSFSKFDLSQMIIRTLVYLRGALLVEISTQLIF